MSDTEVAEVHLSTIAEVKEKISSITKQIGDLEAKAGIPALRDELKIWEKVYEDQIRQAVSLSLFSEDHFQLINKGRVTTVIDAKKAYEILPADIFWSAITVGKGKLEESLASVYETQITDKKEVKKHVETMISSISSKQQGQKYELIDLLSGD